MLLLFVFLSFTIKLTVHQIYEQNLVIVKNYHDGDSNENFLILKIKRKGQWKKCQTLISSFFTVKNYFSHESNVNLDVMGFVHLYSVC